MRILNGAELRDFIKERQAKQVRNLRQSWKVFPKLVIFYASSSPVIETYIRLKKTYGEDILVEVEPIRADIDELPELIKKANQDETVHGIIVQLPLENSAGERLDIAETETILTTISPEKDVDSLNGGDFDAATATAVNWLVSGYNIELKGQKVAIIGNGKLVGAPLAKMWQDSGYDVTVFDETTSDEMAKTLNQFDVVVSAAGVPELIKPEMLKQKAAVIDCGTTSENGTIKGDVAESVRETRDDLKITPKIGGVGPLTVAALIDNVIIAARRVADKAGQKDLTN
ncbi:MAG: bifunctional 5,10-methylenetetrahydrofolate dehydrogenase/5,10-methenyltetrahydrofolate cyclohydrolase [Candidatus Sacchiramonaceae bacterium]|nr:bifunctional 5,10-methylenetetrahydrofolate dehydrogenase/5,10-methenyltetrahydrofolate cyclohydrolase [Candidatus Saccharimonadaceae bacterium]